MFPCLLLSQGAKQVVATYPFGVPGRSPGEKKVSELGIVLGLRRFRLVTMFAVSGLARRIRTFVSRINAVSTGGIQPLLCALKRF